MSDYSDSWMETITGRRISFHTVTAHDIHLDDISRGLAHEVRYAGQTLWPYSVAQHSVYVARAVPLEHAFAAVLHDASEAYLKDIPRPLKKEMGAAYSDIETRFEKAIAERFGLNWPLKNTIISEVDTRILLDERNTLMPNNKGNWLVDQLQPLGITIGRWSSEMVEVTWRAAFEDYRKIHFELTLRGV